MHRLGIIQGRLSPIIDNRIQVFPVEHWKHEFELAVENGFEIIEWIVDIDNIDLNPLLSVKGRREIRSLINATGLAVPSVCCDYFMSHPLQQETLGSFSSRGMLIEILRIAPEVGINIVELPLIGKSGLKQEGAETQFMQWFEFVEPILESFNLKLLLETDLDPDELFRFISKIGSDNIQINYDTGNSAFWSFDAKRELELYGHRIANIHIKDCTPIDYSVPLGKGNVDFDMNFSKFKEMNYPGDFILQTARGQNDVKVAIEYRDFTNFYINKYFK